MSSATLRVLSGYRRLFRARKILFTGDDRAMRESRVAIRAQFDANRNASDPAQIEGFVVMIDEAEDMLLNGIVRGELNRERNTYEVKVKKEHTENMESGTPNQMDPITKETSLNESGNNDVVVTSTCNRGN